MDRPRREAARILDACIKCSACTAECPVARVFPQFLGPKALGPDRERFRLQGFLDEEGILEYCSNCKTCELTCPSGVRITEMIQTTRTGTRAERTRQGRERPTAKHKVRNHLLGRAEYLSRAGSLFAPLSNVFLGLKPARLLLQSTLGLSAQAPFPQYGKKFRIRSGYRLGGGQNGRGSGRTEEKPVRQVVYFPGCLVTYNEAQVGEAVVKVLEHNGYEVHVPDFHCCGVPLEANGYFAEARENARYNLGLMTPFLAKEVKVVTSCSSCGLALKGSYPHVDTPGATRIGPQSEDLFEFLWELYEKGELRTDFQPVSVSAAYHAPCHLKAQGIGVPAVRLLRKIPGVRIEELDAGCCGLSGSYGFKEEKHGIALKIGEPLFSKVRQGRANDQFRWVVSECGSCRLQIEKGSGAPTLHPVAILLAAYGLDGPKSNGNLS